jgi:hypothetical protein
LRSVTTHVRKPLIGRFHSYGARVRMIYMEPAHADLVRQNASRDDAVPPPILNRLIRKLEVPTVIEAIEVRVICLAGLYGATAQDDLDGDGDLNIYCI